VVTSDAVDPTSTRASTDAATGARPVAVVVGPPGAGKTTVAAALADRLGVPFHDVDLAIEQQQGRSISDIFVDDGEPVFRELERDEVARALAEQRGVLALGGGAVMTPETQQALEGHVVVFLDVTIADASRRIGFDRSRPLLSVNPRASWTAMMNTRRPAYQQVATHRVDTAGRTPDEVVDAVLTALGLTATPDAPDAPNAPA
jgi:shikimate kinase